MPLFFVDCCILLDVLRPFKATTYFNFYNFCRLICRRHMVAKCPPHTFRHGRAPSTMRPLATSLILWFSVAFFFIGGRLTPGPRPPLYFVMCPILAPKAAPPVQIK